MVSDADPSDRLTEARHAIERDAHELRARADAARAKVAATLGGITDIRQTLSAVLQQRRNRNGAGPHGDR
jgi:hypothetical protein